MFDMRAELAAVRTDIDAAIARVLDSGVLIGGDEVSHFERELATSVGTARAIGVSSGTDALLAIFMALEIGRDHEVITTPLTFFATAGSAARLGAKIVFADIDPETLTLDPRAALSACGPATRAIVPVHLFGRLADRIALLRSHGARPKYHHVVVGGNFRLDAVQAAVLRAKLPHLARWTAMRRNHAAHYRELFAAAQLPAELRLPGHVAHHVYHQFVIRAPRRNALRDHLRAAGVDTEVYYPTPLHLQPCFEPLGYRAGSLPHAERACEEVLALPIHPALSADARAFVVEQIAAFYRTP